MTTAVNAQNVFNELLSNIHPDKFVKMSYPHFDVRVGVIQKRPPRHSYFDFIRDLGMPDIERVLKHQPLRTGITLSFVFPERWMSVQETTHFMAALHSHPDAVAGRIKQVDILTSSPVILSDIPSAAMQIITFEDDPLPRPSH